MLKKLLCKHLFRVYLTVQVHTFLDKQHPNLHVLEYLLIFGWSLDVGSCPSLDVVFLINNIEN